MQGGVEGHSRGGCRGQVLSQSSNGEGWSCHRGSENKGGNTAILFNLLVLIIHVFIFNLRGGGVVGTSSSDMSNTWCLFMCSAAHYIASLLPPSPPATSSFILPLVFVS